METRDILQELERHINDFDIIIKKEELDKEAIQWLKSSLHIIKIANEHIQEAIYIRDREQVRINEELEYISGKILQQRIDIDNINEKINSIRNNIKTIETNIELRQKELLELRSNLVEIDNILKDDKHAKTLRYRISISRIQGWITWRKRKIKELRGIRTRKNRVKINKQIERLKDRNREGNKRIRELKASISHREKLLVTAAKKRKRLLKDRIRYREKLKHDLEIKLRSYIEEKDSNISFLNDIEKELALNEKKAEGLRIKLQEIDEFTILYEPIEKLNDLVNIILEMVEHEVEITYYLRTSYLPKPENKHSWGIELEGYIKINYELQRYEQNVFTIRRDAFERTINAISLWLSENINTKIGTEVEYKYTDWENIEKTEIEMPVIEELRVALLQDEDKQIRAMLRGVEPASVKHVEMKYTAVTPYGRMIVKRGSAYDDIVTMIEQSLTHHVIYVKGLEYEKKDKYDKDRLGL